jgi:hypothetical protein
VGGGLDSEEDPATVYQFLSGHQGIAFKLVVVLLVGSYLDGCLVIHADI